MNQQQREADLLLQKAQLGTDKAHEEAARIAAQHRPARVA